MLVAGLLVLAGSTAQAGWLFVLAAGVAALLGASLITPQGLRGLYVARESAPSATAGDEVAVKLTVKNASRRAAPPLRLEDDFPGLTPSASFVERLGPGASASAVTVRTAPRRGVFTQGPVTVTSGAPFGFMTARRRFEVASGLTVLPRTVVLRDFPLRDASASRHELQQEVARVGSGSEFVGLRPYRQGDPRRHVHWRSSARRGDLVVREHQEEVMGPVVIALAGLDAGEPPDSSFETMVSAGASIALYALGMGHPLELIAASTDGITRSSQPTRGGALEWFAGLMPNDASLTSLVTGAIGRSGRGSTIVLIAPTCGVAGSSIEEAAHLAMKAGARPLVVAADVAGWDPKMAGIVPPPSRGASRNFTLVKGGDLRTCLNG